MQKFFTDTLMSRFIKYMLTRVHIPLLPCVNSSYPIYEGIKYNYYNSIIECDKTGTLKVKSDAYPDDNLFPASYLFPGDKDVGGYVEATYHTIMNNSNYITNPLNYYSYHSPESYYDPETHKHLGNYLRYIRDCYSIDLLPFYNCYSQKTINNLMLLNDKTNSCIEVKNIDDTNYKLLVVPIKYDHNYTIAFESDKPVFLRAVIWNEKLVSDTNGILYSDYETLRNSFLIKHKTKFSNPFVYNVPLSASNKDELCNLFGQINNLYLIIQVEKSVNSSLVVLEGDYTELNKIECTQKEYKDVNGAVYKSEPIRNFSLNSNLSLLYINDGSSYAFSSRLEEYLLGNVITKYDTLTGNIIRSQIAVEQTLRALHNNNYILSCSRGVWNDKLRQAIVNITESVKDTDFYLDMDGNINRDVENILWQKGGIDFAKLR